jgi:hypothetical protein
MKNSITYQKAKHTLGLHLRSLKNLAKDGTITELSDGSLCEESVNAYRHAIEAERDYILKTEDPVSFKRLSIPLGKSVPTLNRKRKGGFITFIEDDPNFVEAAEARRILLKKPLPPDQKEKNRRTYGELLRRRKQILSLLNEASETE